MMFSPRVRITALSIAVGVAAFVNVVDPFGTDVAAPQVGVAGVALGDDTARIVERVSYRQDVERIGDVIIVDGQPRDELSGDLAAVWEIVDATWPESHRSALAQISVVREELRGLVGVVHPSQVGGWILSLDIADIADRPLIEETIVHELSHVVTLDADVFTFGAVDDCSGAVLALGCAEAGSVLARFANRFWPGDVASANAGDFVNDYASTSAHEDLAETFTAWALGWPLDGEVIDAKIEMLAGDAELLELSNALRVRLNRSSDGS